jgi:hypothetical protein
MQKPVNLGLQDFQIRTDKTVNGFIVDRAVVVCKYIPEINDCARVGDRFEQGLIQSPDPVEGFPNNDKLSLYG